MTVSQTISFPNLNQSVFYGQVSTQLSIHIPVSISVLGQKLLFKPFFKTLIDKWGIN